MTGRTNEDSRTLPAPTGDNLQAQETTYRFGAVEVDLDVPEGVWNPTPHGLHLRDVLATDLRFDDQHVLELGTGCGLHAVVLANRGAKALTLTEIDDETVELARHNVERHDVDIPVDYEVADWTSVDGGPYDALVTNPPFAKSGKQYRRYFIDTLILDTHKLVRPGGTLTFVQSSMADVPRSIGLMKECGMDVRAVAVTDGPFREYYFDDEEFLREAAEVPGGYAVRSGTYYEQLTVLQGTLPS